ncbi:hypothetical protein DVH24_009124 [Malus domestica]|uniref:RNase H type-1 domain-containing protein n=1 Tax=Malus domestica TaxID=3750 RepID=A0A498JM46_MALDO|nr:hypothetical protein DVH24_009124 [Malus domestica]
MEEAFIWYVEGDLRRGLECEDNAGRLWMGYEELCRYTEDGGRAGGCFFNNAAVVEAAAVRAALIFCWEQGCSKVEIESDAQSLVKMINGEVSTDATFDCNLFLTPQLEEVKFLFVPRSGNMAAHAVASRTPSACF